MTRDEAIAILEMDREDAIQAILILAEKAENYDRLCDKPSPTTPSGMTPPLGFPNTVSRHLLPGSQLDSCWENPRECKTGQYLSVSWTA